MTTDPNATLPESLLADLVESAPDALLVVDAQGRIAFANRMAEQLFGYEASELCGSPIERLIPERIRTLHVEHRARFLAQPRTREMGATAIDLVAVRRDGNEFPVEIRLSPLGSGARRFVAAAVRDVTDRRHMVRVLHAAQAEAERANVAKTRFLATASHDLRQPLQTLQLLNAALRRRVSDAEARELLAREREAVDAMTGLLNSLLDVSRLEAANIQPRIEEFGVEGLFEALRNEFGAIAEARSLEFSVTAVVARGLRTDRTLLRQLLENLVGNAIKYTEAGSVRLACRADGDGLMMTVTDTGIGIPASRLDRIFDEYYQIGQSGHYGVGLGLAIVKRIAALLDLGVAVQSEPGRGTEFRISIPPALVTQAAKPEPASAPASAAAAAGAVILLVEDDAAVRGATELYLRAIGHTPIATASRAEAESVLAAGGRRPDLIISDYHLGGGETGVDAIVSVRKQMGRTLPALLLSGDTSTALRQHADLPACRILSKPVDVEQLSSAIAGSLS
ncbi:MAG: PAS domain S-box protein [Steroidobacteraceae bacterium]|nr:PAS domain S-box protein [Steroidobacteraceae bacterium]